MATERDIACLLNEEIGPRDSDYVALVLGDYFGDETSETDYEAVKDMEEEVAVELQVSDLDLESATPDAPATSTMHSCDDMRKQDLQEEELSKFFEHGCGCSDNCYALFSHSYIKTYRCDKRAMAKPVQEIAIESNGSNIYHGGIVDWQPQETEREKEAIFTFMHQGHKVCDYE
uniref:Uncharacterized protein n=1 Tax=Amphimedon queenslandica TaxID=400682 RepID=A0A1X7U0B4_AMPQE